MKMKKSMMVLVAAMVCMSCSQQKVTYQCVAPYPAGIEVENLTDCMVPATFTADDFNWKGGNVTVEVYNEDIYDCVAVTTMKAGDTLVYDGERMVVATIEQQGELWVINGGLEEGGAYLRAYEGGTFRAVQMDDHSVYTLLGKAELPLAENFVIADCGDYPEDPMDSIFTDQKPYIEGLKGYKKDFSFLNTRVLIEHGVVTGVFRHWIP